MLTLLVNTEYTWLMFAHLFLHGKSQITAFNNLVNTSHTLLLMTIWDNNCLYRSNVIVPYVIIL